MVDFPASYVSLPEGFAIPTTKRKSVPHPQIEPPEKKKNITGTVNSSIFGWVSQAISQ